MAQSNVNKGIKADIDNDMAAQNAGSDPQVHAPDMGPLAPMRKQEPGKESKVEPETSPSVSGPSIPLPNPLPVSSTEPIKMVPDTTQALDRIDEAVKLLQQARPDKAEALASVKETTKRLREAVGAPTPEVAEPMTPAPRTGTFEVGDPVQVEADGQIFDGSIIDQNQDGTWEIFTDNGVTLSNVPTEALGSMEHNLHNALTLPASGQLWALDVYTNLNPGGDEASTVAFTAVSRSPEQAQAFARTEAKRRGLDADFGPVTPYSGTEGVFEFEDDRVHSFEGALEATANGIKAEVDGYSLPNYREVLDSLGGDNFFTYEGEKESMSRQWDQAMADPAKAEDLKKRAGTDDFEIWWKGHLADAAKRFESKLITFYSMVQSKNAKVVLQYIGDADRNPVSRKLFEKWTGIKLAKTQKETKRIVEEWAKSDIPLLASITPSLADAARDFAEALAKANPNAQESSESWGKILDQVYAEAMTHQSGDGKEFSPQAQEFWDAALKVLGQSYPWPPKWLKESEAQEFYASQLVARFKSQEAPVSIKADEGVIEVPVFDMDNGQDCGKFLIPDASASEFTEHLKNIFPDVEFTIVETAPAEGVEASVKAKTLEIKGKVSKLSQPQISAIQAAASSFAEAHIKAAAEAKALKAEAKGEGHGGVVKRGNKFVVLNKKGEDIGQHDTREEADKQVAAIKMHMNASSELPEQYALAVGAGDKMTRHVFDKPADMKKHIESLDKRSRVHVLKRTGENTFGPKAKGNAEEVLKDWDEAKIAAPVEAGLKAGQWKDLPSATLNEYPELEAELKKTGPLATKFFLDILREEAELAGELSAESRADADPGESTRHPNFETMTTEGVKQVLDDTKNYSIEAQLYIADLKKREDWPHVQDLLLDAYRNIYTERYNAVLKAIDDNEKERKAVEAAKAGALAVKAETDPALLNEGSPNAADDVKGGSPLKAKDKAPLPKGLPEDTKVLYRNFYHCDKDGLDWEDVWNSMSEDECPTCGKFLTPLKSEELEVERGTLPAPTPTQAAVEGLVVKASVFDKEPSLDMGNGWVLRRKEKKEGGKEKPEDKKAESEELEKRMGEKKMPEEIKASLRAIANKPEKFKGFHQRLKEKGFKTHKGSGDRFPDLRTEDLPEIREIAKAHGASFEPFKSQMPGEEGKVMLEFPFLYEEDQKKLEASLQATDKEKAPELELVDPEGKVVETMPDAFGDDPELIKKLVHKLIPESKKKEEKPKAEGEKPEPKEEGAKAEDGKGGKPAPSEKPLALPAIKPIEVTKEEEAQLKSVQEAAESRILAVRQLVKDMVAGGMIVADQKDVDRHLMAGKTLTAAQDEALKDSAIRQYDILRCMTGDALIAIRAGLGNTLKASQTPATLQASSEGLEMVDGLRLRVDRTLGSGQGVDLADALGAFR